MKRGREISVREKGENSISRVHIKVGRLVHRRREPTSDGRTGGKVDEPGGGESLLFVCPL